MPADWYMKSANSLHRGLIKLSGGKLGWSAIARSTSGVSRVVKVFEYLPAK